MIRNSILECVGGTPVVRLSRLIKADSPSIFLKLENMNPGGSHKIRVAVNMIREAENSGKLMRGSNQVLVDGSGGNAGIGIAIAAAVFRYRALLVIPKGFSKRKQDIIKAYGAEVVLCENSQGADSHFAIAKRLCDENENYVYLGQTENDANPRAHWRETASEIIDDFSRMPVDAIVCGVGSGGHISGIAYRLKTVWPEMRVVAVQPEGCDILNGCYSSHGIQGIGVGNFSVFDKSIIDEVVTVSTPSAVSASRMLMRTEGISVGISSGANVFAALEIAKADKASKTILTFGYDNGSDYPESLLEE